MAATLKEVSPSERNDDIPLLPEAIQVWKEVAEHLKSETQAPLASSKSALEFASEYLGTHEQARQFVEQNMDGLVRQILSQVSPKEESDERQCTEECLKLSVVIIAKDVGIQLERNGNSLLVDVLTKLFCRENKYYQETIGKKTRFTVIDKFQVQGGYSSLSKYLSSSEQMDDSKCPLELLLCIVDSVQDLVESKETMATSLRILQTYENILLGLGSDDLQKDIESLKNVLYSFDDVADEADEFVPNFTSSLDERKNDGILIGNVILRLIRTTSLDRIEDMPLESFSRIIESTGTMLDYSSTSAVCHGFDGVCRQLILQLIKSKSHQLKDLGWNQVLVLVYRAIKHRPPFRTVTVSKAGCKFVNGIYSFKGTTCENGYVPPGSCALYVRKVPNNSPCEAAGETLRLFATERSDGDLFVWYLSAFSTTNDDMDDSEFYTAVSRDPHQPPLIGWQGENITGSMPSLKYEGFVMPAGKECNTLEHHLAKWAVSEKVIELYFEGTGHDAKRLAIMGLIRLLASLQKRAASSDNSIRMFNQSDYCLRDSHVLLLWREYVACNHDEEESDSSFCSVLLAVFLWLPENLQLTLLRSMGNSFIPDTSQKSVTFIGNLLGIAERLEGRLLDLAYGLPSLSDAVRREIKKLMWRKRTSVKAELNYNSDFALTWLKWESFRESSHAAIPPKAEVSILDPKSRFIEVSLPLESLSGEYHVGIFITASCDSYENGLLILLASIIRGDIEQCLMEDEDRVNVQVCLPDDGLWSIEWRGALLRKEIVVAQRSFLTFVDLTVRDKELMKRHLEEVGATDELARKHAGDIQSTICKLRGSSSSKMTIESRFSLLHTAVAGGRSALNKLRRLVATNECDETSISGIVSLENALAAAQLPLAELEASLNSRNRKERIKGFKAHVTALLENEEVASWLESVQPKELDSLGGDSNRLYQLLVDAKGSQLNTAAIEMASTRADLFSKKQIKTLTSLGEEVRRTWHTGKVNEKPAESFTMAPISLQNHNVKQAHTATALATVSSITQHSCSKEPLVKGTSHPSTESLLLKFLQENADCLKGSPEAFHRWLVDSEDISSLNDLADAVADDQYLQDGLQQGGLKGFKRSAFKKAVLVATGRDQSDVEEQNKENEQPPSQLVCPLSRLLMTNEAVVAADGHTYELAAIAEWFEKQNQQVEAAKEQIAAGNKSKELQSIVDRGIVSPVTHATMDSLALAPNKTVQAMARDAANAKKRRVPPFGSISS